MLYETSTCNTLLCRSVGTIPLAGDWELAACTHYTDKSLVQIHHITYLEDI